MTTEFCLFVSLRTSGCKHTWCDSVYYSFFYYSVVSGSPFRLALTSFSCTLGILWGHSRGEEAQMLGGRQCVLHPRPVMAWTLETLLFPRGNGIGDHHLGTWCCWLPHCVWAFFSGQSGTWCLSVRLPASWVYAVGSSSNSRPQNFYWTHRSPCPHTEKLQTSTAPNRIPHLPQATLHTIVSEQWSPHYL